MADWNKAKVVDFQAELKQGDLPQTGQKAELLARLTTAGNEDGVDSEATIQGDSLKQNASAAPFPDTRSPTQPQTTETVPDTTPQTTSKPIPASSEQAAVTEPEHVDTSMTDSQREPLPTQSTKTIESSQSQPQPKPERSALPSVEPQEVIEDRQKRKRRSQSPPISSADAARKRFRKSDNVDANSDEATTSQSKSAWIEKNNGVLEAKINATSGITVEVGKEEPLAQDEDKGKVEGTPNQEGAHPSSEDVESPPRTRRDSRYKDLFSPTQSTPAMGVQSLEKTMSRDPAHDEAEPERIISPAIHPATSALYIRNFMRPLNPGQLKSYLAGLATPPGRDVDADVVVDFYLDQIRTHAFVSFQTVSAASRVRSALHDRIWPDERNRKPLWVDFVPSDKAKEWIDVEESNIAGRGLGRKWEVSYDVDEDRHVTASLREVSNVPRPQSARKPSAQFPSQASPVPATASVVPRGIQGAPSGPRAERNRDHNRGQRAAANLATLHQLFRSTRAEPVLYWEPVSKSIANKRLDALENAKSKRYSPGGSDDEDINRYTFQDGHVLVDRGPELFGGLRPPPGYRGPGRGGTTRVLSSRGGYGGGRERGIERVYGGYRGGGGDRRGSRDDRGGGSDRRGSRDDRGDVRSGRGDYERRY
jgi:hypothetical protein